MIDMMKVKRSLLAGCLLLTLPACSTGPAVDEVVRLEPSVRIFLDTLIPPILDAHQAGLLGSERAVLYNDFEKRLHVVSLIAPHDVQASFGKSGPGPGEIQNVWELVTLADGSIALWDTPAQRLLVMDATGLILLDERLRGEPNLRFPSMVRFGPSAVAIMPIWATEPKSTAWVRELPTGAGGGEWRTIDIPPPLADRPGQPIPGGSSTGMLVQSWVDAPFEVLGFRDSVALEILRDVEQQPPLRAESEATAMAERRALAMALGQEGGTVSAPMPSPEEFRTMPFVHRLFVDECEDVWIISNVREVTDRLVLRVSEGGGQRRLVLPWDLQVEDIRFGRLLGLLPDPATGLPELVLFDLGLSCESEVQ